MRRGVCTIRDDRHADVMQNNMEYLNLWYEEYLAVDVQDWLPLPAIIRAVEQDEVGNEHCEQLVQQHISLMLEFKYFCGKCREAFDHWPGFDGSGQAHATDSFPEAMGQIYASDTIALEAGSRKGCRFCSFILHLMVDEGVLQIFRGVEKRLKMLGKREVFTVCLYSGWHGMGASIDLPGRRDRRDSLADFHISYLDPGSDTYERQNDMFEIAAEWLFECDQCHNTCNLRARDLPTRLLHIRDDDVQLVNTVEGITTSRYATLSHCWGNVEFLKLSKSNMDNFLRSIPTDELPQTLMDAIYITRRLGLEYIWIDSLCIIQNDEEDWQVEAGRMSSMYGGSYLNIAASAARSATDGCFLKAQDRTEGFRARITSSDRTSVVAQFEREAGYNETVVDSHLATRAWTFQEKILSIRTIHFGNRGMFWECASKVSNEYLRDGLLAYHRAMLKEFYQMGGSTSWWSEAIRVYSSANITFPRDMLPALSGIAEQIHALTGKAYLAGIWWDEYIEQQLCWTVGRGSRVHESTDAPSVALPRPAYRAPSWSWVSVDDAVWVPAQGVACESYAHVLDAWTTPSRACDSFGEVADGAVRIACSALLAGFFSSHRARCYDDGETTVVGHAEGTCDVHVWKDASETFDDTDEYQCFLLPLEVGNSKIGRAWRAF